MTDRIPRERYAGRTPTPFAVYRPGNVFGMPAGDDQATMLASIMLGIAFLSGLAVMQDRDKQLKAREDALVAAAESAATPEAVLAALAASAEERAAIGVERTQLSTDIAVEAARRERERSAPSLDLPAGVDAAVAAGVTITAVKPTEAPKPFAVFGDFLGAVRQSTINAKSGGAPDPRLVAIEEWSQVQAAASGMNETVGSDGGFLVQTDVSDRLLSRIDTEAVIWPLAEPVPLSANSNGTKINLIDETSRATGSRWGGVQVYWEPEATAATAKKPKIFPLELNLAKLFGLGYQTGELGQDSTAAGALMESAFTSEMAFSLDDAAIRGSGAGQPKGILNAASLVTVSKETGQTADTVVAENVIKMFARMAPRSLDRAVWYLNQALWPQIFQLQLVIGTGGVPMFIPSGGLGSSPGGTLLGRPIRTIEQASAPGDVGDITFADFGQYLRLEKGGIQRASSIHVEFLTDQEVFRWILRTNGAPGWVSAVTPYKGSDTISPFVALEAR